MFSKQELPLHFGNKKSSGVSGMPMIDKWVKKYKKEFL